MKPPILTIEQARSLDQKIIEDYGFPSILLMENAGRGLANIVVQTLERFPHNTQVLIFCGPGNNGGDGFVAARHLFLKRYPVQLYVSKDTNQLSGDAKINSALVHKLRISISPLADFLRMSANFKNNPLLIVDALLGTGSHGEISSPMKETIEKINNLRLFHNAKVTVIAADIPSGVNGDSGIAGHVAVKADITASFGSYKKGLTTAQSKNLVGKLEFVDIGIPESFLSSFPK